MIKNCYRLKEYSRLSELAIDAEDAGELAGNFAGKVDITPSLNQPGHYNLQSYQFVGTIALANTTIIIEPKTPVTNLAYMLAVVYQLIHWQETARVYTTIDEWCELAMAKFLDELLELIHGGLKQDFRDISDNLALIRGQIDFTSQLAENFGQPLRHRCTYDDLSIDLPENRLLKLALTRINRYLWDYRLASAQEAPVRSSELPKDDAQCQRRRRQLLQAETGLANVRLPDGEDPDSIAADFAGINFTRLNEHYRKPLALARMVIELTTPIRPVANLQQPLERGCWPAFLIDMNRLFERYLATRMSANFPPGDPQSFNYRPINQQPSNNQSSNNQSINQQPINHRSIDNQPINPSAINQQSINQQSINQQPIDYQTINNQPNSNQSINHQFVAQSLTLRYQTQVALDCDSSLMIKPDFLIERDGIAVAVMDAKYKLQAEVADYYQMAAYALALGVSRAILIYPGWQFVEADRREVRLKNCQIIIESRSIELAGTVAALNQSIDKLVEDIRG